MSSIRLTTLCHSVILIKSDLSYCVISVQVLNCLICYIVSPVTCFTNQTLLTAPRPVQNNCCSGELVVMMASGMNIFLARAIIVNKKNIRTRQYKCRALDPSAKIKPKCHSLRTFPRLLSSLLQHITTTLLTTQFQSSHLYPSIRIILSLACLFLRLFSATSSSHCSPLNTTLSLSHCNFPCLRWPPWSCLIALSLFQSLLLFYKPLFCLFFCLLSSYLSVITSLSLSLSTVGARPAPSRFSEQLIFITLLAF